MIHRYTLQLSLVFLCSVLLTGCSFPGRRLLNMEVYQDNQLVLKTTFDVPDSEPPSEFWEYASEEPFSVDSTLPELPTGSTAALECTLTGLIEIKILHGDQLMTSAKFESVRLVRKSPDGGWHLPAEAAQTARQSGQHRW